MLDWLGHEGDELKKAFRAVFGPNYRPFGSRALAIGGLSDGNEGVQWNVAYDPGEKGRWVGVNLEGKKYTDWPVARLIRRELRDPTFLSVIAMAEGVGSAEVKWARDYWQVTSRPPIIERHISPTPIRFDALTGQLWRQALQGALDCLEPTDSGWRRARQEVTLKVSGQRVLGEVSPHLTCIYRARPPVPWTDFLREARARMQPIYDWAVARAA